MQIPTLETPTELDLLSISDLNFSAGSISIGRMVDLIKPHKLSFPPNHPYCSCLHLLGSVQMVYLFTQILPHPQNQREMEYEITMLLSHFPNAQMVIDVPS
ncbi:hypothetical protein SLE2022_311380 [Rubroshorea leprosula]